MAEYEATGGWDVTSNWMPDGRRCLTRDEGSYDVVYDSNPLGPEQMRALAALLIAEADRMEADG